MTPGHSGDTPWRHTLLRQPALPAYRVPVFRALQSNLGGRLRIAYGSVPNLPNADADLPNLEFAPFRTVRVPGLGSILLDSSLLSIVRRCRPEVVVLPWTPRVLSYFWQIPILRAMRVGVIVWGHGRSKTRRRGSHLGLEILARLAGTCLCYGPTAGRRWRSRIGRWVDVRVAVNALASGRSQELAAHWFAHPAALAARCTSYAIPSEAEVILFVSRLHADNELSVALRAMALLQPDRRPILVIVGDGQEEKAKLEALVSSLAITASVIFVPGIYDEEELSVLFSRASAFCYPSNAGLSLHHAWAYGLPVFVGDDASKHNPEIDLCSADNSVLFRHSDPYALAAALSSIPSLSIHKETMSANCRQAVVVNSVESLAGAIADAVRRRQRPTEHQRRMDQ